MNRHSDESICPTNEPGIEFKISQEPDGRFIATVPGAPVIGTGMCRSEAVLQCNSKYQDWLIDQEYFEKKPRFWFYKPGTWHPGWNPFYLGGDEWDRHTLVIGWSWTGAVVIAYRDCRFTGKCAVLKEWD